MNSERTVEVSVSVLVEEVLRMRPGETLRITMGGALVPGSPATVTAVHYRDDVPVLLDGGCDATHGAIFDPAKKSAE